jgi:hypothetical protein
MRIEKPGSQDDIRQMVKLYANYDEEKIGDALFKLSTKKGYKSLAAALQNGEWCRLIRDKGHITAWILCKIMPHPFTDEKIFQQYFFASSYTGIAAARAVKLLHQEMEEYARTQGYPAIVSTGSHLDETYIFTRMLEKLGWTRRGYLAMKRLAPASRHQTAPLRRKRGRGMAAPMPS